MNKLNKSREALNLAINIVKDKYGNYENWYWHEKGMNEYGIIVLNSIVNSGDVLDVGSGWNTISIAAHLMGNQVISVDLFTEPTPFDGIKIIKNNIQDPEFELGQKFDYILLLEVLEHLNFNVKPTLLKLKSWLKDDGYLIISTPDKIRFNENLPDIILPEYDKNIQVKDSHIRFYDEDDLDYLEIESKIEIGPRNIYYVKGGK